MSSQSPSQSHEAFGPDSDPLITISACEVSHIAQQDCSSAEPLGILSITQEPHHHVKPETCFPEHIEVFTTDTMPHLIQEETSSAPLILDHTQPNNISELDNIVGAIAVSPSLAEEPSVSEPSTENSLPLNPTCSVEDNMLMSSSESVQRPKLRKRKAKS